MLGQQDVVYLGDYKLISFASERNTVFFNARRIDGIGFTEKDESELFQLLESIGKWEKYVLYIKYKQKDICDEDSDQLVTPHQFYTFTPFNVPEARMRVGRRYGMIIEPATEQFEVKYQIAMENIVEFVRESLINLQKWMYSRELV